MYVQINDKFYQLRTDEPKVNVEKLRFEKKTFTYL